MSWRGRSCLDRLWGGVGNLFDEEARRGVFGCERLLLEDEMWGWALEKRGQVEMIWVVEGHRAEGYILLMEVGVLSIEAEVEAEVILLEEQRNLDLVKL